MFGLLLLVLLLGALVVVVARHRSTAPGEETPTSELAATLARWVEASLLTAPQAEAIAAFERERVPVSRRRVLVGEVLGYIGGALVAAAVAVLVGQRWDDISSAGRIAAFAVPAAVLGVAGWRALLMRQPVFDRLGSILWFVATGLAAATTVEWAADVADWDASSVLLTVGLASTAVAGPMYAWRRLPLQHLALFAAAAVTVTGAVDQFQPDDTGPYGLALWTFGTAWFVLGREQRLAPWPVAELLGGAAALVAGQVIAADHRGIGLVLGLATAGVLVALSLPWRDSVVLGVGTVGLLVFVPAVVVHYFGDTLGAPVALFLAGVVLLVVALLGARSHPRLHHP